MPHSALYFPYIEVPDKPSLTRVLLYWDQLETIAPWAIPDLGERMEDLIDCGLVKRVEPEEHLPHIDGFEDGFVALLDRAEQNRRLAHDGERGTRRSRMADSTPELVHRGKAWHEPRPQPQGLSGGSGEPRETLTPSWGLPPDRPAQSSSRLHRDKVTWHLWEELADRGYVKETHMDRGDGGWMLVEEWVASLYMAYLALSLARRMGLEPVTDEERALAAVAGVDRPMGRVALDRMRSVVISRVLPAPTIPIPPGELARFKDEHWESLCSFRLHVEQAILSCAKEPDPDLRDRCVRLAAETLEHEVVEVENKMAEHHWPTGRGMFIAGFGSSLVPAAKFAATGDPWSLGEALAPPVAAVAGALLGRGPADVESPVAYAALARSAFATPS
jgi:hypothetical protein